MKRTDITALLPDAPKETIDKLMDLNGADINAAKSEADSLRKQLQDLQGNDKSEALKTATEEITKLKAELDGMRKTEEIRGIREKVAGEKKVPSHLLTGETEEACAAQADAINAFAENRGQPLRDRGEVRTPPDTSPKASFKRWLIENT